MVKSKARKKREHMLRNTGKDAAASRGKAPDFSTHVRKTKSRREELAKLHMKHKRKNPYDLLHEDHKGSFFRRCANTCMCPDVRLNHSKGHRFVKRPPAENRGAPPFFCFSCSCCHSISQAAWL